MAILNYMFELIAVIGFRSHWINRIYVLDSLKGHDRRIRQAFSNTSGTGPSTSGRIWTRVLRNSGQYVEAFIWCGYIGLASVYPTTMVIALVNGHRSLDQMYSVGTSWRINRGADHTGSSTSVPQETKNVVNINDVLGDA
ncbi:hypothetical protein BDZ94DRAFT_1240888 [Collybia nuda]|uniref:Uncharacterized protein n=1 Tax=Collybia nuda TaxID=64659 RepID=A0A9P6C9L1_9AGAR|nr:hypothetical protein BDZ94DRAFT_1240888 [Collybia nuda]